MNDTGIQHIAKGTPKRHRPRLVAAVNESCTGCEVCVDFCPVDCIDDVPPAHSPEEILPRIRIREPECIGCQICAKVCEELAWNAIEMISLDEFQRRSGHCVGPPTAAASTMA